MLKLNIRVLDFTPSLYVATAPPVQRKELQLTAMASNKVSAAKPRCDSRAAEFSINTLRSEQELEEKLTCGEWCANGESKLLASYVKAGHLT